MIFDLDGTAVPNSSDGMPTKHLVDVIKNLQQNMRVCAATGRPFFNSKAIFQKLGLTDPCIISGGTQIINPNTGEILWEKDMDKSQVEKIMSVALPYSCKVFFSDDENSTPAKEKAVKGAERIVYLEEIDQKSTEIILKKLNQIPNIIAYKLISWKPNYFDIHVVNSEATKKHALEILLKMFNINSSEVIAAGDGNNDLPLFELAGYKIAMANGTKDLKKEADIIALSVNEDGLAIALENIYKHTPLGLPTSSVS